MAASVEQNPIFIVDDDRGLLRLIEKALQREGFQTATAPSGEAAQVWLARNQAALMLLDLKLQDVEGGELIEGLAAAGHCPPFIIITGQGDERVAVEMMKRGALDYLIKDVDFLQFVPDVVRRALEHLDQQRRLAEAEQQVRLIKSVVEQGFSAVLITSAELPDPRVVYINPAFARATGYSVGAVEGRRLSSLLSLAAIQERLRRDMRQNEPFLEHVAIYQTPGGERWGEWRVGPVKDKSGAITHWLIIFRDITESKRLEKEILEISDREQQRIGQDLHDGLCQHLAGIELMSQALEQKLLARSKDGAARAGEIARHVRDVIAQTRRLSRGLSPVTLQSEGLASALEELAANAEKMFGIECRLKSEDAVGVGELPVVTHLYRIAQEAVSNAIRHGHARKVLIELRQCGERILLRVTDDGRGFPKELASAGMGLRIMRSRAGMIGGVLAIESRPQSGTIVTCSIPAPATGLP
jgi:PAS domain S-box-containing protein